MLKNDDLPLLMTIRDAYQRGLNAQQVEEGLLQNKNSTPVPAAEVRVKQQAQTSNEDSFLQEIRAMRLEFEKKYGKVPEGYEPFAKQPEKDEIKAFNERMDRFEQRLAALEEQQARNEKVPPYWLTLTI